MIIKKGLFSFQCTLCMNWKLFSQSKPLSVLNYTNTIYYSNVYVSLQLSDVNIKINRQSSFSSKMSIRCSRTSHCLYEKVLSVTFTSELPFSVSRFLKRFGLEKFNFHFRATVQCLQVPQTFWTGEIQLALLYFLRFQTIIHGWHDNCAIFPPSVFRYHIFFWIFFSATTIWLMELVFLINPVRLGKLVVLSRNVV